MFDDVGGVIHCESEALKGCDVQLDFPSVGATENVMLAAVFAEGETFIRNAAKEPEIIDLQKFLNGIGADVHGAGTSVIKVCGVKKTRDTEHILIPDRIVAGTYMAACAATRGNMRLQNVIPEHLSYISSILKEMGCELKILDHSICIKTPKRLKSVEIIRTHPYPGFPTDMQAQIVAVLSLCSGTSVVVENVFDSRFLYTEELAKMGARIKTEGKVAIIKGSRTLRGANVMARDLRGGAALVIAGLAAEGKTSVDCVWHIDRGYMHIEKTLSRLGASIKRID